MPASVPRSCVATKALIAAASFGLPLRKAHAIATGWLAMSERLVRSGKTWV